MENSGLSIAMTLNFSLRIIIMWRLAGCAACYAHCWCEHRDNYVSIATYTSSVHSTFQLLVFVYIM
jgi:hypothetical protein